MVSWVLMSFEVSVMYRKSAVHENGEERWLKSGLIDHRGTIGIRMNAMPFL
jgi:hypothetical protein